MNFDEMTKDDMLKLICEYVNEYQAQIMFPCAFEHLDRSELVAMIEGFRTNYDMEDVK